MPDAQSVKNLIEDGVAVLSVIYMGTRIVEDHPLPQDLADGLVKASAVLEFARSDPRRGAHRVDLTKAFSQARRSPDVGKVVLQGAFGNLLVMVWHQIEAGRLAPRRGAPGAPLFQLLRHLRHAAAHGNKFTFRGREPKDPAGYRTLHLDASMNGRPNVLFDFISPGDTLDLLDAVAGYL
jgi:hypothetical protein